MGTIRLAAVRGPFEINLNDIAGLYHLAPGFVPPPVSQIPNLAHGTSANRRGGAELISIKAANRSMNFALHVTGKSEAEITGAIRNLDAFLRSGTPDDPVSIHYRSSEDVGFEPLWGQYGADRRYEIVFGQAAASAGYPLGVLTRQILPDCEVDLQVKPYALGLQQRVGSAIGGILEDTIGTGDGISRGTIIPEATTNKMTNPIFGHATYDNGWTTDSDLIQSENTDPEFITHGKSSVKLIRKASTNIEFYQNINVGNTNTHVISCYAKRPDGAAVTATDAKIIYVGTQPTTYESMGNGWYRLSAVVTGVAASRLAGIGMESVGAALYVDGFQLEEKAYLTPLAHGDMLGCAWTGTAHASTSTRTVGDLNVVSADAIDIAEGTVRVVWKADKANTDFSANAQLWRVPMRGTFLFATDTWEFHDNTQGVSSSAQTFAVGDIVVLHFVYGPGQLSLYVNGTLNGSGTTYTPPTLSTELDIGQNAGASHIGGTFMDFTTFAQAMTATEVSDDYDNALRQVEDDRRLSPIPWLWTKDGDDIVDNDNLAGNDNWALISGVPGSAPAEVELRAEVVDEIDTLWISRISMDQDRFVDPAILFIDISGSVTVTTSDITLGDFDALNVLTSEILYGKQFSMFTRIADAGSGLIIFSRLAEGTYKLDSERLTIGATVPVRLFSTRANTFTSRFGLANLNFQPTRSIFATRDSGSASVTPDWFAMMLEPLTKIGPPTGLAATVGDFILKGKVAFAHVSDTIKASLPVSGAVLELEPEKLNVLMTISGDIGNNPLPTDTLVYTKVLLTPRWALL